MTNEVPETKDLPIKSILLKHKEEILASRKYVEKIPGALTDFDMGLIAVGNYHYLVRSGVLSEEEYGSLLKKCVDADDYTELGLRFTAALREQTEAYLRRTDLPQTGDAFHPGRDNLENALAIIDGDEQGIREVKERDGKNPASNMGSPPFDEQPEWLLGITQSNMTMAKVYAHLEGSRTGTGSNVDTVIGQSRSDESASLSA